MDSYTILPSGCWQWTGTTSHGRPIYNPGKKLCGTRYAYRVAYYLRHGKLNPKMQICHSCDNPLCINPQHLFEGTNQDNIEDSICKGRRLRKLTLDQAQKISNSTLKDHELSELYGVSRTHIARIRKGKSKSSPQATINKPGIKDLRVLSPEQVLQIRSSSATNKELAIKYGCSKSVIQRIRAGKTYMDVAPQDEV